MNNFETYLQNVLNTYKNSRVKDAMNYSLLAGGKRIRPRLLLAALKDYGMEEENAYSIGAAIEMIHTYSLIHDDLPAMDDDTLRRGRNTCHVEFDEATAILAGDALLTHAFYMVANSTYDPRIIQKIIIALSIYAGGEGMVYGQTKDIEAEGKVDLCLEDILEIHEYKTAKLLTLPLICAAYISKHDEHIPMWIQFGKAIGLSFQIQDDILDVTSSEEILGKNINSDISQHKITYVSLKGIEQSKIDYENYYNEALQLLKNMHLKNGEVQNIIEELRKRKN